MTAPEAAPLPSATVLLLRDAADGLEVFMVKRHHQIDFASGALVFPGGKLEKSDADPALRAMTTGGEGLDDLTLSLRIAAIRESFEECGILLARPKGSSALLAGAEAEAVESRWRAKLNANTATMTEMAAAEGLSLAVDTMVPFAHWITPVGLPKRFDTHFFVAATPPDQLAGHDGRESVDSVWISPAKAVSEADAGRVTLVFATRMNLVKLGRSATTAAALAAARGDKVVTVMPVVTKTEKGRVLRIPIEAGYGAAEFNVEGQPRP
ncbi:NUDIX hydrolase [Desertibaculum subflavum]|uniref:NUDIX hydrolase n=1 Tax=Desertibaculum subflavum TaxID=2268458 RepID=UPI000E6649C6